VNQLVIFTEEESMKAALEIILPKLGLTDFLIISHQGVSDLEKSLPKKLRSWTNPNAKFLVLRDNDRGDCIARKQKLIDIAKKAGRGEKTMVRIVCQELEAWFIGDQHALRSAGIIKGTSIPKSLRGEPDEQQYPFKVLQGLKPDYQKIAGAKEIASSMDVDNNSSKSFNYTVAAVLKLASP